jgi:hypothetical protein
MPKEIKSGIAERIATLKKIDPKLEEHVLKQEKEYKVEMRATNRGFPFNLGYKIKSIFTGGSGYQKKDRFATARTVFSVVAIGLAVAGFFFPPAAIAGAILGTVLGVVDVVHGAVQAHRQWGSMTTKEKVRAGVMIGINSVVTVGLGLVSASAIGSLITGASFLSEVGAIANTSQSVVSKTGIAIENAETAAGVVRGTETGAAIIGKVGSLARVASVRVAPQVLTNSVNVFGNGIQTGFWARRVQRRRHAASMQAIQKKAQEFQKRGEDRSRTGRGGK